MGSGLVEKHLCAIAVISQLAQALPAADRFLCTLMLASAAPSRRASVVVRAQEAAAPAAPKKVEVGPKRGSTVGGVLQHVAWFVCDFW